MGETKVQTTKIEERKGLKRKLVLLTKARTAIGAVLGQGHIFCYIDLEFELVEESLLQIQKIAWREGVENKNSSHCKQVRSFTPNSENFANGRG